MKKFILLCVLVLTMPLAFGTNLDQNTQSAADNSELQEEQSRPVASEDDGDLIGTDNNDIQEEEDLEMKTGEGEEVEVDRDMIGDDEIELND